MKQVNVTTGFGIITMGNGSNYRNKCAIGTMVIDDDASYEPVTEEQFNVFKSNKYISDDLITWALSQVFAADLIPHMAAFLDFANKASQAATDNFRAYATAVIQSVLAETIIAKAIELGAKIV